MEDYLQLIDAFCARVGGIRFHIGPAKIETDCIGLAPDVGGPYFLEYNPVSHKNPLKPIWEPDPRLVPDERIAAYRGLNCFAIDVQKAGGYEQAKGHLWQWICDLEARGTVVRADYKTHAQGTELLIYGSVRTALRLQ